MHRTYINIGSFIVCDWRHRVFWASRFRIFKLHAAEIFLRSWQVFSWSRNCRNMSTC